MENCLALSTKTRHWPSLSSTNSQEEYAAALFIEAKKEKNSIMDYLESNDDENNAYQIHIKIYDLKLKLCLGVNISATQKR